MKKIVVSLSSAMLIASTSSALKAMQRNDPSSLSNRLQERKTQARKGLLAPSTGSANYSSAYKVLEQSSALPAAPATRVTPGTSYASMLKKDVAAQRAALKTMEVAKSAEQTNKRIATVLIAAATSSAADATNPSGCFNLKSLNLPSALASSTPDSTTANFAVVTNNGTDATMMFDVPLGTTSSTIALATAPAPAPAATVTAPPTAPAATFSYWNYVSPSYYIWGLPKQ